MSDDPLPNSDFILYQTEDGRTRIQCRFENESIWLSQAHIADLFQITVPTVNEHLKGIYADRELAVEATILKFQIVRLEGKREVAREIEHYNLDDIRASERRVYLRVQEILALARVWGDEVRAHVPESTEHAT